MKSIDFFAIFDISVLDRALRSEHFALIVTEMKDGGDKIIPVYDKELLASYREALLKAGHESKEIYRLLRFVAEQGIMVNNLNEARENALEKDGVPYFFIKEMPDDDTALHEGTFTASPHAALGLMKGMHALAKNAGKEFEERLERNYREALDTLKSMIPDDKDGFIGEFFKEEVR